MGFGVGVCRAAASCARSAAPAVSAAACSDASSLRSAAARALVALSSCTA